MKKIKKERAERERKQRIVWVLMKGSYSYDCLGSSSYDCLGRSSYGCLGSYSYDYLGTYSYDRLRKL